MTSSTSQNQNSSSVSVVAWCDTTWILLMVGYRIWNRPRKKKKRKRKKRRKYGIYVDKNKDTIILYLSFSDLTPEA